MNAIAQDVSPGIQSAAELHKLWQQVIQDKKMRVRDAAEFLGVSECELVATMAGQEATRLSAHGTHWVEIVKRVCSLGRVMALTRNHAVVHERKGVYLDVSATGQMGLALGADIDLRFFFSHWHHGFAVTEQDGDLVKRSIQFFDAAGDAVHKIFLQPESSVDEFEMLVEQFRAEDQMPGVHVTALDPTPALKRDEDVSLAQFHEDWSQLKDTHEFFGMLKRHGLARTQALRLAEERFAYRVELTSTKVMLDAASAQSAEIMCFVGNRGCIQIHTGFAHNIKMMGPWLNVLDPDFNLHLRDDLVDQAWVVKKPTTEGIVTALELFDRDGVQIAQFFGKRKPGIPERDDWRAIVETLPRLEQDNAQHGVAR
jgi:putative hemin transport protein